MEIIHLTYPLRTDLLQSVTNQVLAIGDFDGVHLGHQQVIREALDLGRTSGVQVGVMTFHPHPREILGNLDDFSYLTPLSFKLERFKSLGVDRAYVVAFDTYFSKVQPEQFIKQVLKPLQVHTVVVGFNFTFGHKGLGTPDTFEKYGLPAHVIRPFLHESQKQISSTFIRGELASGQIEHVTQLLGRPYTVQGRVIHGEGRGKKIGFPTANIQLDAPFVTPKLGVYAVNVTWLNNTYRGVMNIGVKPTFHDSLPAPTYEVHILDFDQDIYGETLEISFLKHLRNERKFNGIDELIAQIKKDIQAAR